MRFREEMLTSNCSELFYDQLTHLQCALLKSLFVVDSHTPGLARVNIPTSLEDWGSSNIQMSGIFITDKPTMGCRYRRNRRRDDDASANTTIKAPIAFEALFWSPLVNYSCPQDKSCPSFFRVRNSQCTNDRLESA